MKRYIMSRLIRSLFSILAVMTIVFNLIYTAIPRERVFFSDTNIEKLQKRPDDLLNYKHLQWERLGYIDYRTIQQFCRGAYEPASEDFTRCIKPDSPETQLFADGFEAAGFNVGFFPDSGKAFAYRDIPTLRRSLNWWAGLIQVDHPWRVKNLEPQLRIGPDFAGNPALICQGCQHKYLIYLSGTFPFLHQNLLQLNLGVSYPTYSGRTVVDVLTSSQGAKVLRETVGPGGEVRETALDLHTCRFKENPDHLQQAFFEDQYVDCRPVREGPSMMRISFIIGLVSLGISYLIGIPAGIYMAQKQGQAFDRFGQAYIIGMMSIPSLAYIVLVRFVGGRYLGLPTMFPLLGAGDWRSYILPAASLAIGQVAGRMMWTRRYMIDQSAMDYVRFARAKGLSEGQIFQNHIFRNAMGPLAHGIPAAVILTIAGALITESVYSIPGMGKVLPDAINVYNNSMVIGITFVFTALSILSTFLGDLLLVFLDPRISLHEKGGGR